MKITKEKFYGIPMYECYIDFYSQYFYLFFGKKNLKKFADYVEDDEFEFSARCMVFLHEDKKFPRCIYMWFPTREYKIIKQGILAHECLHLIDWISKGKGFHHDIENQEVYAQFMGYLFSSLLPFFKKK